MTHQPKTFTITDPRTFDGDPFEVAERAALQSAAVAGILHECLEGAWIMVRNAELERQLLTDGDCDAPGFDDTPQGRRLVNLRTQAQDAQKALETLAKAAAYNPKNPPRA